VLDILKKKPDIGALSLKKVHIEEASSRWENYWNCGKVEIRMNSQIGVRNARISKSTKAGWLLKI